MRISFVMIVLNGMPFIETALKSIYESAYEIIIIEGAVEKCKFAANPDGSSKDGTIEFVKAFPDQAKKIKFVQGQWPEKCEMQNKALELCSGDYIWLVDSDEVYKKEDIDTIIKILDKNPTIAEVRFPVFHFWKGFDYVISSEIMKNSTGFYRIFKINKPCHFTTHRPPTLLWEIQKKATSLMKVLDAVTLKKEGVYLYHYSYVLDKQVKQKIELYKRYGYDRVWGLDLDSWYVNCFLKWTIENKDEIEKNHPIWTADWNSKTERFVDVHPESILEMKQCLK